VAGLHTGKTRKTIKISKTSQIRETRNTSKMSKTCEKSKTRNTS
jgi:hypothetical protein